MYTLYIVLIVQYTLSITKIERMELEAGNFVGFFSTFKRFFWPKNHLILLVFLAQICFNRLRFEIEESNSNWLGNLEGFLVHTDIFGPVSPSWNEILRTPLTNRQKMFNRKWTFRGDFSSKTRTEDGEDLPANT